MNVLNKSSIGKDKAEIEMLVALSIKTRPFNVVRYQFIPEKDVLGSRPVDVPMDPNKKLLKDEGEIPEKIPSSVSVVSQFLEAPQVSHWEVVTRIIRYVKRQPGLGILYRPNGHVSLEGFTDADWAGSPSDRRSITGYCTFFNGNLVTWNSKKQTVVARSSAEAEYRAMAHTTTELTWLQHFLQEIGFSAATPISLSCDN
ncbi:secreted RxLR effector protein 161-like [Corylus avellana]|uniref:secreted RxLR effector protein 161-like n=1 Tax=Corylus avellana TaxID=13451 RepID=UPI00286B9DE2|nr:secreted RxLR effector protein 161-like [Corylus avellana]